MKIRIRAFAASIVALTAFAASAQASFTAKITADNHYALYVDGPAGVTLVGGNELGAAGNPGTYNWSKAETFTFDTLGYIYIAAWSDDRVAQGLIADIRDSSGKKYHTGVAPWEVTMTDAPKSDNSAWPLASEIGMYSAQADSNNLWENPYVGPKNKSTTQPWGKIAGIDENARWTWGNPNNVANPLIGGADHAEYQIFRLAIVPTPGAFGIASAGLLLIARRRK